MFNEDDHKATMHRIASELSLKDASLFDLLYLGLHAEEAHVKQYALWRIAQQLELTKFLADVTDHGKLV